jgi:hypothetical protein
MPRPNFFNDNVNRTFPFQWKTAGVGTPASGSVTMLELPDDFVADCGFIVGPESGFVEGIHTVFLYKISRVSSTQVDFEFRCDAPNLADSPLIFSRESSEAIYSTSYAESDNPNPFPSSQSLSLSESILSPECGEPYWSGYLVTGRLESVFSLLGVGDTITRTSTNEAVVEPALIQNMDQSQLVSVSLGNADRTRDKWDSINCAPNQWPFPTGEIFISSDCLQGDIRLRAGYNTVIRQNKITNTIEFAAVEGAGEGQPCGEIKLFPEEQPPIDSTNGLLDGDFRCNDTLRTINGIQGPKLTLYGGVGVSVLPDPSNNRVIVDINLVDLSICSYSAVSESI